MRTPLLLTIASVFALSAMDTFTILNGTNFSGIAGNTWGTIVPTRSSGAVSGNTGGGLGTTDPAANLV